MTYPTHALSVSQLFALPKHAIFVSRLFYSAQVRHICEKIIDTGQAFEVSESPLRTGYTRHYFTFPWMPRFYFITLFLSSPNAMRDSLLDLNPEFEKIQRFLLAYVSVLCLIEISPQRKLLPSSVETPCYYVEIRQGFGTTYCLHISVVTIVQRIRSPVCF